MTLTPTPMLQLHIGYHSCAHNGCAAEACTAETAAYIAKARVEHLYGWLWRLQTVVQYPRWLLMTSQYPVMNAKKKRKSSVTSPPSLESGCFSSNWIALQSTLDESALHERERGKKVVGKRKKNTSVKDEPARKKNKGSNQQAA